jgi:iron complex outermembrane receptor protein
MTRNVSTLLLTALLCGCATGAFAQAAPQAGASASASNTLGEVVVTAQRRSESVERVPMSVAVVSPTTLQKSGVASIHDLSALVAGASVSFAGCCSQPAIRGISTLTTGVGYENNVAIYIDGFYVPDNLSVNGDLANISSIEVLKGPQGALWGRNATGGAILINTSAPSKTLAGAFEAGYGAYNEVTAKAYLSGPITDRLGFSIAAAVRNSDGYDKWIGPTGAEINGRLAPQRQVTLRTKLQLEVTDWLTATAAYNYADSSDPRGDIFQFYAHTGSYFCVLNCFSVASMNRSTGAYEGSPDERPITDVRLNEGTLKLEAQTPYGKLTSNTGFAHRGTTLDFDFDESWIAALDSYQYYAQDTFQESVNYNITAIEHLDLVVGAEYMHDDQAEVRGSPYSEINVPLSLYSVFNPALPSTILNYTTQSWSKISRSYAFYLDATYHLTDALSVDVGGRYSNDYVHVGAAETPSPWATAHDSFSAFTPRGSIRYELAPRTSVYFTYSQGYRNGGFNPVPPLQTTPFQPEKIKSYEVGFKAANNWIQYSAAAFYYDYRNMQVGIVEQTGATLTDLTANAKAAQLYGLDNDITMRPMDHMTLRAGVEWLHGRYTDFNNYSGTGLCAVANANTAALGCTAANLGSNLSETQNLDGKRMIRAPDWSGFVGGDYEFQDVFGGSLDAAVNVTFTTEAPTENASLFGAADPAEAGKERYVDPAYTLVNATLTWKDASNHYTAELWARNLGNTKYLITNAGLYPYGDFRSYGEPMTGGFRVGYKF